MKCKFCFAELEEDVTVCPLCGKELTEPEENIPAEETPAEEVPSEVTTEEEAAEETPVEAETAEEDTVEEEILAEKPAENKKKGKGWIIALAVTGLVVLALALTGVVLHFMGYADDVLRVFGIGKNDIYYKDSYTVSDEKVNKASDTVIATLGDQKLTVGELQAHYWPGVINFVNYYGAYMGVDISKPFSEQIYDQETGMTFEQLFLDLALESWKDRATWVQMAKDNGFTLTAEQQSEMDGIPELIQNLATESGYTDLDAFIAKEFYPGCTLEDYLNYYEANFIYICYMNSLENTLIPTQADIEEYYTLREEAFKQNKHSKEDGLYYDVRHILIPIDGGTDAGDGTKIYSDEDWANCLAKAQKVLDDFIAANGTESDFAEWAGDLSADPGSANNGGLYSNLTKNYGFIADFEAWYVDESRKPGDTGLVKNTQSSTQGYHVMYFSGSEPIWQREAAAAIFEEKSNALYEETAKKWPMEVNYKKIVLGQLDLTGGN